MITMVLAPPAFADDGWWNRNDNSDWSNTGCWAWGSKPGPDNTAWIGYAGYANPSIVSISSPQVTGNVYLGWNSSYSGTINMTSGSASLSVSSGIERKRELVVIL
jgi:hypothetical protein